MVVISCPYCAGSVPPTYNVTGSVPVLLLVLERNLAILIGNRVYGSFRRLPFVLFL